jgi:hypothetical protein
MLTCGPRVSERKGSAGESERAWARRAAHEREERQSGESTQAGLRRKEVGRAWLLGRAWKRREKRGDPRERERER